MNWHMVEGEPGCRFARERGYVAVVVDALRASATVAMFLEAGVLELLVVREVEEARAAKAADPAALLAGERGGLPPEGFDLGNSPLEAPCAKGRRVIFTSTTGAGRLLEAWGAHAVLLGSTVNASATVRAAEGHGRDVVLIPAGLAGDPAFDAQEDRAAAAYLGMAAGGVAGEGATLYEQWRTRIEAEGIERLFATAPHAGKLRRIGREADIAYCARIDLTRRVPVAVARRGCGVVVRAAGEGAAMF